MTTTVLLVRHSEKMRHPLNAWENFDRIQPLSVRGEEKARGLLEVEQLRNADAVFCSPFARTLSTLRYIMEEDGLRPTLDERLRELDFGAMMGHGSMPPEGPPPLGDDIRARQWIDRDLAAPGGESLNQCAGRMTEAIKECVMKYPGGKILVGSHGAAIGAYLSSMVDYIDDEYTRNIPQPAVFRLTFEDEKVTAIEQIPLASMAEK